VGSKIPGFVVSVEGFVGDVAWLDSDGRTVQEWKRVESRISGFCRLRWSRRRLLVRKG